MWKGMSQVGVCYLTSGNLHWPRWAGAKWQLTSWLVYLFLFWACGFGGFPRYDVTTWLSWQHVKRRWLDNSPRALRWLVGCTQALRWLVDSRWCQQSRIWHISTEDEEGCCWRVTLLRNSSRPRVTGNVYTFPTFCLQLPHHTDNSFVAVLFQNIEFTGVTYIFADKAPT